jgi:2-iminobutanoate/2-iminopropanoate deaminase
LVATGLRVDFLIRGIRGRPLSPVIYYLKPEIQAEGEKHMPRKEIIAANAAAIGPYSHAIDAGEFVYLSGQTPIDPSSGKLVEGDITLQTEQCFSNLLAVLSAGGLSAEDVIKVNVYLVDMADFAAMNAVYARQFMPPYPARTTVAVAALPLGASVEIEMIARKGQ